MSDTADVQALGAETLEAIRDRFAFHRRLGEGAMAQLSDAQLVETPGEDLNSVDVIVRHMAGNLRSRFTDFFTTDGEKPWRHRDTEFLEEQRTRETILADWESGWQVLEGLLGSLGPGDLMREVVIRGQPHSVVLALLRQLSHHSYHVGQIVVVARAHVGEAWRSLSVPRGGSDAFNRGMGHDTAKPG